MSESSIVKVLVTGHRGFLGAAFCERFARSYDFVGYDLKDGDDLHDLDRLVERMEGCDQVVHLAAIPRPVEGEPLERFFEENVVATLGVLRTAERAGVRRFVYASSTTIYGIEHGIPFSTPIEENQPFVSQYLTADRLSCREEALSYNASKVMAEQLVAWFGLNRKLETIALRFGPINKQFLGTSVSLANATNAIDCAIRALGEFWYEPFSIVDELEHIDISRAKERLGYAPSPIEYTGDQVHSTLDERAR